MLKELLAENPIVQAPMAGVTDKAFRLMARKFGCGLEYSEMISAKALTYQNKKTFELLDTADESDYINIQLFGSEPEVMAEGAQIACAHGAKMIDINMGCPVPKVVKNGEGSALMQNTPLAAEIVREMKKAVNVPITVKMRIGWDEANINAVEFAKAMEEAGAELLAVHGRTRSQYYSGHANWAEIAKVKAAVDIPVLANGDVNTLADCRAILVETGCDGVMIGRGALGKPWFYGECLEYLKSGAIKHEPSLREKCALILEHAKLAIQYKGEHIAMCEMRHHLAWYFKGWPNSSKMRGELSTVATYNELVQLLKRYVEGNNLQNDV